MIIIDRNSKNLAIPRGLGNFINEGSGGGVSPEEAREIAEEVVTDALVDYVDETQLSDTLADYATTAETANNTEDISTLSATTEEISQQIGSLSGLTDDIAAISGQTTANTQDIGILSGATMAIEQSLGNYATTADTKAIQDSLANYATTADTKAIQDGLDIYATTATTDGLSTDITALSGVSSALTASVSALTANDNIAFFNLIKDYGNSNEELARLYDDMDAANTAGKTVVALSNFATGDTSNAAVFVTFRKDMNGGFYGAGSGVHYNGTTYIAARAMPVFRRDDYYNVIKKDGHFYFSDMGTIAPYTLPTASSSTKGGIKVGSGLTMSGEVMSIKAGDGLGFSGDTLVVSGVSSGPTEYFLNNMSQQELATLYAEISGITEGVSDSANIPEILSNYKFFIATETDGQKWSEAFFSNWEGVWDDELQEQIQALWITTLKPPKPSYACGVMRSWAQIKPNGSVEFNSDSFDASSVASASNDITIQINSAGTITNTDNLGELSSLARFSKIWFAYNDENVQNSWNTAPLSYFYRKQVGDDLMEYFGCTINIDGTFYKGTWSTPEWGWSNELAADTWTTV